MIEKNTTSAVDRGTTKGFSGKQTFRSAFPGKYIQGEGAISLLPALVDSLGKKGLIIGSLSGIGRILADQGLSAELGSLDKEAFSGECCLSEIDRLEELVRQKKADVIIGMGGGKVIDTAKVVADRIGIPVIVVPTIASTDAPCSGCAVLYSDDGIFQSVYYPRSNPDVVLMDVSLISKAPVRFLVSGIGDALSTWFEARSCDLSGSMNECGGHPTLTGFNLARLCYETILRYGEEAKAANEKKIVTPSLHYVIEANTLMSGIGFESGGLATAHSVHNGLSHLEGTHAYYHGEKVTFGVLTGLHLARSPMKEMEEVYGFCERIGLPTTLAAIGLSHNDGEGLMKAAIHSCEPDSRIHHEPFTVTASMVFQAMLNADSMGRSRMSRHP
jgi:glycerol dehydrogenase